MLDKTIEQLLKTFAHLAREIQTYFLSGCLVILNVLVQDYFHYSHSLFDFWSDKDYSLVIFILVLLGYIIGHIIRSILFAFYALYLFLCNKPKDEKVKKQIEVFETKPAVYNEFIERYSILLRMRLNFGGALLLIAGVDFIYWIKFRYWQVGGIALLSILFFITLMVLSRQTYLDFNERLKES